MPTKVKITQENSESKVIHYDQHLLWLLICLYMKVLIMKFRLCLSQLDFCLSLTSSKAKKGLSQGQWNILLNKNEMNETSPSQLEFLYLTVFKIYMLYYGWFPRDLLPLFIRYNEIITTKVMITVTSLRSTHKLIIKRSLHLALKCTIIKTLEWPHA